jgi:hypothetical protein
MTNILAYYGTPLIKAVKGLLYKPQNELMPWLNVVALDLDLSLERKVQPLNQT